MKRYLSKVQMAFLMSFLFFLAYHGPAVAEIKIEKNVMVPMSDGIKLSTDVYLPENLPAPTIVIRTPYGKNKNRSLCRKFAKNGYAVVIQDVRGRFGSEGNFYPFVDDSKDGSETIRWILKQSFCNGKLGTYGGSYLGTVQWALAPLVPELGAMHMTVTSPNYSEVIYQGGELHLMTVFSWSVVMGEHRTNTKVITKAARLNKIMASLPLNMADDKAVGYNIGYFDDIIDTQPPDGKALKLMEQMDYEKNYAKISAPVISFAGWYDMFLGPQLKDYNRLVKEAKDKARDSYLVIGPWAHGPNGDGTVDYGKEAKGLNSLNKMAFRTALDWFGYHLKGENTGIDKWHKVKIFVMGENKWREENEWPLARTIYTKYYLHSGGNANTRNGDGTLNTEMPEEEPPDKFDYDPLNPVPTKGGCNLGLSAGAHNQAKIEDRKDVLVYTSAVLDKELEVTGPITATIYAESSAIDTDFSVKLVDVYPDGTPVNIQDGIIRASYRDGDLRNPSPIEPGKVYEYKIDLWATSNLFKKGHRIRVEVSSSNFPRFNRNLNTFEPVSNAQRAVIAHQTVHHCSRYPSHITLPVIPR